jgi:hypothetical protein
MEANMNWRYEQGIGRGIFVRLANFFNKRSIQEYLDSQWIDMETIWRNVLSIGA